MFYVYILTTKSNSVLYVGVTNDLKRRMEEHQNGSFGGFPERYQVKKLVHYEEYTSPLDAISREKQLKCWRREKKVDLIERCNPNWEEIDV